MDDWLDGIIIEFEIWSTFDGASTSNSIQSTPALRPILPPNATIPSTFTNPTAMSSSSTSTDDSSHDSTTAATTRCWKLGSTTTTTTKRRTNFAVVLHWGVHRIRTTLLERTLPSIKPLTRLLVGLCLLGLRRAAASRPHLLWSSQKTKRAFGMLDGTTLKKTRKRACLQSLGRIWGS